MANWQLLTLQLSWFTPQARQHEALAIFRKLIGDEPDGFQRNRAPSQNNPTLSTADGFIGEVAVHVQILHARIDVILQRGPRQDTDEPQFIRDYKGVVTDMAERAKSMAEFVEGSTRLSMISTLVELTENVEQSAESFFKMVGTEGPKDATDLTYQINVRRDIDANVRLNRLLIYSVIQFQRIMMEVGASRASTIPTLIKAGAQLVLDINTVPVMNPLSPDQQLRIWDSIVEESLELQGAGTPKGLWS